MLHFSSYVRIVQSKNPGNGKSLYIQRLGEKLMNSLNIEIPIIRIPIHGPDVPYNNILNKLSDLTQDDAKIIHFDIAATVSLFLFVLYNLYSCNIFVDAEESGKFFVLCSCFGLFERS